MRDKRENYANLEPSIELSYLLGAVLGDGYFCFTNRSYMIGFDSTEEQLVQAVQERFSKILEFTPKYHFEKRQGYTHGGIYRIRFSCKSFYSLVSNYESLTQTVLVHPEAFLAGIFDTEGSIDILVHHFPRVFIYNTEIPLIEVCCSCLKELEIDYHITKREYPANYFELHNDLFLPSWRS